MKQGTITVDWHPNKPAMVITYPGGKIEEAFNKKDALHKIKIWAQTLTDTVAKVSGSPTISTAKIEWHNNTNG